MVVSAIQFTDRGTAVRLSGVSGALARAALTARKAPSILNSQPWRWRVDGQVLELHADRSRQVTGVDPDGRLLTLSCGVALHHVRTALAVESIRVRVEYLPSPEDPDLLAVITHLGPAGPADPATMRAYRAIATRHSDRRPFDEVPVPETVLDRLRVAAEQAGAYVQFASAGQVSWLTLAGERAGQVELTDPGMRNAVAGWMRESGSPDGVPVESVGPRAARPVPIRPFLPGGTVTTGPAPAPPHGDRQARYAVICTDADSPRDWLTAGEALSAFLLAATAEGLATSMMSDLVEVPEARALLQRTLSRTGYPAIVVRVGRPAAGPAPAPAARRPGQETVQVVGWPTDAP
jgi:nitroreductase